MLRWTLTRGIAQQRAMCRSMATSSKGRPLRRAAAFLHRRRGGRLLAAGSTGEGEPLLLSHVRMLPLLDDMKVDHFEGVAMAK